MPAPTPSSVSRSRRDGRSCTSQGPSSTIHSGAADCRKIALAAVVIELATTNSTVAPK
jgi:hypothetical protein